MKQYLWCLSLCTQCLCTLPATCLKLNNCWMNEWTRCKLISAVGECLLWHHLNLYNKMISIQIQLMVLKGSVFHQNDFNFLILVGIDIKLRGLPASFSTILSGHVVLPSHPSFYPHNSFHSSVLPLTFS